MPSTAISHRLAVAQACRSGGTATSMPRHGTGLGGAAWSGTVHRRSRGPAAAELTVTLQITVTGTALPAVAAQILAEIQELAERLTGTGVTVTPITESAPVLDPPQPSGADTTQVAGIDVHAPGLYIWPAGRAVWRDGAPVQFTRREFDLLLFLCEHPRRVFNRDQLLDLVWGRDSGSGSRTVDVHIRRLRKKLGDDLVATVRRVGYRLDEQVQFAIVEEPAGPKNLLNG
jgi:DNA-binding winged helix-turn-helix (wHTH) protein